MPPLNYSTLNLNANAGVNTIILNDDLGLQQGDQVVIGCGTLNGQLTETTKGLYTVSSYNSSTKTITLTANLGTNRLQGDYVAIYNRPINFIATNKPGSQYNLTPYISSAEGCLFKQLMPQLYGSSSWFSGYFRFNTFDTSTPFFYYSGGTLTDSLIYQNGSSNAQVAKLAVECLVQNLIVINTITGLNTSSDIYLNSCIFQNVGTVNSTSVFLMVEGIKAYNCIFKNIAMLGSNCHNTNLYNCKFDSILPPIDNSAYPGISDYIESFNHNNIINNYATFSTAGNITIDTDKTLKFSLNNNSDALWRDYKFFAPANRK
jgi:hypothetical protein